MIFLKSLSMAVLLFVVISKSCYANELWSSSLSSDQSTGQFVHESYDIDLVASVLADLNEGDTVSLPLPEQTFNLKVTLKRNDGDIVVLTGSLNDNPNSLFYLDINNTQLNGLFYEEDSPVGFRFEYSDNNRLYKMDIDQISCLNYGLSGSSPKETGMSIPTIYTDSLSSHSSATVTNFESLPGSMYVLYIDFDGETVDDEYYSGSYNDGNPIVAAPFDLDGNPSDFNSTELLYIETTWKAVSEDYSLFDVNVTTDRSIYDAASEHKRSITIVTPSCHWLVCSPNVYGKGAQPQFGAYANCPSCGNYSPAWAFPYTGSGNLRRSAEGVAHDVSHEFGHGFWLIHDGETHTRPSGTVYTQEYYDGNSEWVPIMGFVVPASDKFVTFSKGEYLNANEDQDDIAQINYHLSFRFDSNELYTGEGVRNGIIGSYDEDDYTFFAKPTDTLNLMVSPRVIGVTNLDARLQLYDPDGVLVVDANPSNSYNASIIHGPTKQGTYKVRVSGVGSTTANSYTRYGSIGQYTLNIARSQINPDPVPMVMAPIYYLLDDD